jgi:16S rRNA C967 or C1407 C5-methylase (RsmB/RsmF family)
VLPVDVLTPEGDLLTRPDLHGADGFFAARLVRPIG